MIASLANTVAQTAAQGMSGGTQRDPAQIRARIQALQAEIQTLQGQLGGEAVRPAETTPSMVAGWLQGRSTQQQLMTPPVTPAPGQAGSGQMTIPQTPPRSQSQGAGSRPWMRNFNR